MKILKMTLAVAVVLAVAFPVSAGWNFKSLKNLEVSVDYSGYSHRNSAGDPVYTIGNMMMYRITIINRGNRPFKGFPIESSLYYGSAGTCQRFWYDNAVVSYSPLLKLPGNSVSGTRYVDIPKNGMAHIDVNYMVSNESCPALGEVTLDANRGGGKESLRIPMRFEMIAP